MTPGGSPAAAASPRSGAQQVCPSDPTKPLLEPEALSIIHAASSDPAVPSAQQLATGAGVKVAFVADGVDVNNPEFIRPDGSHVIVDYRDFSGDGLDAPTIGEEGFGDASSIAAQGRKVYDLSTYVNTAHPLPVGCTITVRGVAPGASLVAMKVFPLGDRAPTSTILQGLDWAVAVDHVDVLNESFGSDELPSTTQDLIRQFDDAATAAGVTVVVSSGDAGPTNTIGSPADDPNVISAGATTQLQGNAQVALGGSQFATGGWLDNNIAWFSSAGFTQAGGKVDLVAPGDEGWAACTPDLDLYYACSDFNGNPTSLLLWGARASRPRSSRARQRW